MNFGALKLVPWFLIAVLVGVCGVQYGFKVKAEAKRDEAVRSVDELTKANKANADAIAELVQAERDNTRLVQALSADLAKIDRRFENTDRALKDAYRNDPQSRDWASQPVPSSVRRALEAGR